MHISSAGKLLEKVAVRARNSWNKRFAPAASSARHEKKPERGVLDVFDLQAVVKFIQKRDETMLEWALEDAETSVPGASRMVLGYLRENEDLRLRFPAALSSGPDGGYCRELTQIRAKELQLSPVAIEHIRSVFLDPPGKRTLHVYLQLPALHTSDTLGMTPVGGKRFVDWMLKHGRSQYQLRDDEILWFLHEATEDPWPVLSLQYLTQPRWQEQFPCALTHAGAAEWTEWLMREKKIRALDPSTLQPVLCAEEELRILCQNRIEFRDLEPQAWEDPSALLRAAKAVGRRLPRKARTHWMNGLAKAVASGALQKSGVNVIGHFSYPSGLQRSARTIAEALNLGGHRLSLRDLPAGLRSDTEDRSSFLGLEIFDITLSVAAPSAPYRELHARSGLHLRDGVHRIGVWYWELDQLPPEWIDRAKSMQEIWAPSRFIADAMRSVMPVPVYEMPPGVALPEAPYLQRTAFGLPEDCFLFLFMFDMCSVMERKNPLALIRAFQLAFENTGGVSLAIKVLRGHAFMDDFLQLQEAAAAAGVHLIDGSFSHQETLGLLNSCDAYVSLHRSEGFGLTMAEAMLLGKPVVATGYSGNMDFMNPSNSLLVGYDLVPITRDTQFYAKGNRWAEPSIEDAAQKMRWLFDHPAEARALGEKARQDATALLSLEAAVRRMTTRIDQIRASALSVGSRQKSAASDRG